MRKNRWISVLIALCLLLGIFSPAAGGCVQAEEVTPESLLAEMTTQEKLTQMMVMSLRKFGDKSVTVLPEELSEYFQKQTFGGYIFFAENHTDTEQTMRLINDLRQADGKGIQPLMTIDQEGGAVTRLAEGVEGPGNMALSATGDPADITTMASIIGNDLVNVGIDVNFSPVTDVNNNPANPIIGVRSFSDDPQTVAEYCVLMEKGLQEQGVITCLKHFPGHGDTQTDSHTGFPRIDKTYDQLKSMELIPFRSAIEAGTEMIMTAHIMYPEIEKTRYDSAKTGESVYLPATLSKTILTDILRGDLGYDGLIVTDAMDMDAIAAYFEIEDAILLAIGAGANMMMIPANLSTAEDIEAFDDLLSKVVAKVEADETLMQNVNDSVLRILKLKQKYGLLTPYDDSDLESRIATAKANVSTRADHATEWDITKRAITLVKNDGNVLPLTREGEKTVIITCWNDEPFAADYAVDLVRQEGKLPEGSTYEVHSLRKTEIEGQTGNATEEEVRSWVADADNVINISEMASLKYLNRFDAKLIDAALEEVHKHGGKFILLSVLLPYDVTRFPDADAVVCTYECRSMNVDPRTDTEPMKQYGPNIAAGLYLMLKGDEPPTGKLPVNLPKLNDTGDGYTTAEGKLTEIVYPRGHGLTYEKEDPGEDPGGDPGEDPEKKDAKNEWLDGVWYGKDGTPGKEHPYKAAWKKTSKGTRYVDTSGWYPKKCWQKIDRKWYYFDKNGYKEYSGYRSGYYLNKDGARTSTTQAIGWKITKKGKRYYTKKGTYLKNCWKQINGSKYYFDKNGYIETMAYRQGRYLTKTGAWNGKTVPGWKTTKKGKRYSLGNGKYLKSGWKKIGGNTYYFDKNGYIIASAFVKGKWLSKAGVCSTKYNASWHKTTKGWWYGNKTGWRAKGKKYMIDGKQYHFNKNGYCTNR